MEGSSYKSQISFHLDILSVQRVTHLDRGRVDEVTFLNHASRYMFRLKRLSKIENQCPQRIGWGSGDGERVTL